MADMRVQHGDKVIFVTSDNQAYKVAVSESATRSNYSAYHFWQCQCTDCKDVFPVKKGKNMTCPNCEQILCTPCSIINCNNPLVVDL